MIFEKSICLELPLNIPSAYALGLDLLRKVCSVSVVVAAVLTCCLYPKKSVRDWLTKNSTIHSNLTIHYQARVSP